MACGAASAAQGPVERGNQMSSALSCCWDTTPKTHNLREERFIMAQVSVRSQLASRQKATAEGPGGGQLLMAWGTGSRRDRRSPREEDAPFQPDPTS